MAIDWTNIGTQTPPKYKFVLDSELGVTTLKTSPLEWKEMILKMVRDKDYEGVMTEFAAGDFTFVEDGKDILKDLKSQRGIFANCKLKVYYLDYNTRSYKEMPTSFKMDFNTYKLVKVRKAAEGVQIKAMPVGIFSKLKQRKNMNVNLLNTTSVGGYNIQIKDHWTNLRDAVHYPDINSYTRAYFSDSSKDNFQLDTDNTTKNFIIPQTIVYADFSECQNVDYLEFNNFPISLDYMFFEQTTQERTVLCYGNVSYRVNTFINSTLNIYIGKMEDAGGGQVQLVSSHSIHSKTAAAPGIYAFPFSQKLTITEDQSLCIYGIGECKLKAELDFTFITNDLNVREKNISVTETDVEGMPIYEATERLLQLITDKQYPLYSEFFGRTDVYYNADGDQYSSENQLRFANIMSGLNIRGLELDDEANNLVIKLKDWFDTLRALYNVGLGIEEIDGDYKVRIEEREYFFDNSEGLDLSDRIQSIEIEEEMLPDRIFTNILSGWENFEYEENGGRGEYNTKNERISEAPSDSRYQNIAKYRGDTMGMTLLLEKPLEDYGTEDVKGDDKVFILKTQWDEGNNRWNAEEEENITVLENSSYYEDGSLNLYYSPTRMLFRHDYVLASGLNKAANTYIRYQTSEKLSTLKTTDGTRIITENEDILVYDLGNPRWHPVKLLVEVPFYESDYQTIKDNKYKYIKLSDDKSGWIIKFEWEITKNKAKLELLEKWD